MRCFRFGVILVLFVCFSLAGCSSGGQIATSTSPAGSSPSAATNKTPTSSSSNSPDYLMQVLAGAGSPVTLQLADLHKLRSATIQAAGRQEEGPTLTAVLALAGVKDYSQVTASGYARGRLATADLTLAKAQISDSVILSYSNQNTVKLCGVDIPFDNWVIDVNKLAVK